MCTILREHALKNMWGESTQDRQYIIKPARQTSLMGASCVSKLLWEGVTLPDFGLHTGKTWHVYSLGKLPAWLMAINLPTKKWLNCNKVNHDNSVVIDIYLDNGCIVPNTDSYLYQNHDGNFVLAIERKNNDYGQYTKKSTYGDFMEVDYSLDNCPITVRFYNNAVIQSTAWRENAASPDKVLVNVEQYIEKEADYFTFLRKCQDVENQYGNQGKIVYYLDGFMISKPNVWKTSYVGHRLIGRFDETVKDIVKFRINDLPGFKSEIDIRDDKYLVHPKDDIKTLEYFDDQDFYLVALDELGNYKGVYIDRLYKSNIRQVTNASWSIKSSLIHNLASRHDFLNQYENLYIVVVRRTAGMNHALGFQSVRLDDLYRLPYNEIIEAMTKTESNAEFWKAAKLESSAYARLLSSKEKQIDCDLLIEGYGYNAATKAVNQTLYPVTGNVVKLDSAFLISNTSKQPTVDNRKNSRVYFWYDENRLLIGYSSDTINTKVVKVPVQFSEAKYVEVFLGKLAMEHEDDGTYVNELVVQDIYNGFYGYRLYCCNLIDGMPDYKWSDVTNESFAIVKHNPLRIEWDETLLENAQLYPCTRVAKAVTVIEHEIPVEFNPTGLFIPLVGVVSFNIVSDALPLVYSNIDVFMNGKQLIYGLDYSITDESMLIITKQSELDVAKILIRYYGYPSLETGKPYKPRDYGFIKNGRVSSNDIYNPYKDRVSKVVVDGLTYSLSDVRFSEDTADGNLFDGKAYAVIDYNPIVEPYLNKATAEYQHESILKDRVVSDYLSPRLKEPKPVNEYIQGDLWPLYSPFVADVISMMLTGELSDEAIDELITNNELFVKFNLLYDTYREHDPAILNHDSEYVTIQPVPFTDSKYSVTAKQYATLEQLINHFLDNKVDITHHVTIE